MAWEDILDAEIDQDSPLTVRVMTAIRDNLGAAFAGDVGAPRLDTTGSATSFPDVATGTLYGYNDQTEYSKNGTSFTTRAEFVCLCEGVINLRAQLKVGASTGDACEVRFRKNGVLQNTKSTTGTTYVERDFDMTVAVGDLIHIDHRSEDSGTTAFVRGIRLRTSGVTPWIVVLTGLADFRFPAR